MLYLKYRSELVLCITCQDLLTCCNQVFVSELEEGVKKVRGRLVKTEFVILSDWNARIIDLQINWPHTHVGHLLHDGWQKGWKLLE